MKNTSASESACFKMKATKPIEYLVRPNKGIIHAQETESIQGNPIVSGNKGMCPRGFYDMDWLFKINDIVCSSFVEI